MTASFCAAKFESEICLCFLYLAYTVPLINVIFGLYTMFKDKKTRRKQEGDAENVEFQRYVGSILSTLRTDLNLLLFNDHGIFPMIFLSLLNHTYHCYT